jgi:internalin A
MEPKSFAQWYLEKDSLPIEIVRTIDALMVVAETDDYQLADEKLRTMQKLYLRGKQISNLEPLSSLTSLTNLDLAKNQIYNIEPLASLVNLITLDLGDNQINNLEPLTNLVNLTNLILNNNQIISLEPLSGLSNLQSLIISDNNISNIEPLSELTNLAVIWLQGNHISHLEPLAQLNKMRFLMLGGNPIKSLEPIASLELAILDLRPRIQSTDDSFLINRNDPLTGLMDILYFNEYQRTNIDSLRRPIYFAKAAEFQEWFTYWAFTKPLDLIMEETSKAQ